MGLMEIVRGAGPEAMAAGLDEARDDEVNGLRETLQLFEAQLVDLERALLEPGWQRMSALGDMEFTRQGLGNIAQLCRLMAIKNPLLRRAVAISVYYVFGQGVSIAGKKDDTVGGVVADLVDDPGNQAVVFGESAQAEIERALRTDANLFLALFTSPVTGRVQIRDVPFDQVVDIITDPQDRARVWFYDRQWSEQVRDPRTGATSSRQRRLLYPALDYWPQSRPQTMFGAQVQWDAPVLHVHTNRPRNWLFGIPELYPALDWARAHAEFLDDFRRLIKVLAKLAWKLTGVKGSQMERAQAQLAAATSDTAPAGQAWVGAQGGGELEPIMKSGSAVQIKPADARQFALMVASATDIPETMLMGDPSTGNLATATTLDRPTELAFEWRRKVHAGVYQRLCQYAIDQAVIAPRGPLQGVVERDGDRLMVTVAGDVDRTVSVDWPPIQERDMADVIKTLVDGPGKGAVAIPGMPPAEILRIALTALDVDGVDEIVAAAEESLARAGDERTEQDDEIAETLRELSEAIRAAA